jgi:uncharacterized damage-inducible protein DinB
MAQSNLPEVWLRGPLPGVPGLLQPVAHTLLQAREEINALMKDFPEEKLWEKPAGLASPAFHLQHIVGVLDRLFTYANGNELSNQQLEYLSAEGKYDANVPLNELLENLRKKIETTVAELKFLNEETLTEFRGVGRKQLPSTVLGLVFHAAEHTMRHLGQLLVTVRILKAER